MQTSILRQCAASQRTDLPTRLADSLRSIGARTHASASLSSRSQHHLILHRIAGRRRNISVQAKQLQGADPSTPESTGSSLADKQALFGPLSLLGTALLWGTNAPANRFLYLQGPGQAPIPSLIPAVQTTGAALVLFLIDAIIRQARQSESDDTNTSSSLTRTAAATAEPPSQGWPFNILAASQTNIGTAAFEIGFWSFAANCLTVAGFANTTTSRGAFLVRLSAVFTPVVAATVGDKVAVPVWIGSLAALAGGVFIGADGNSGADGSAGLSLASGDILLIIAAVVWSIQTVRVGKVAPNFQPLQLAKRQLGTMALLSTAWFAKDAIAAVNQGSSLESLWGGYNQALNWGVLLFPAIGPWSVGVALQMKGQSTVPASVAMLIFATDPVWAILYAGLLGGNEQHLGTFGLIGAGCILSASIIASFGGNKKA